MSRVSALREVPPTAGLPPRWSDWWPTGTRTPLLPPGVESGLLQSSGTASLVIALETLRQLKPDRHVVIVPAYTCPLVAIAVAHCGLELRLCDTARDHFDFDPDALAALCDNRTLAVIPTHLGGRTADVAHSLVCARANGAYVIEDAAQAWGAQINGRSVGLHGDIGFFSLAVGKGITTYEGGVLAARETSMREGLRAMRERVLERRLGWELLRTLQLASYTALYRPAALRVAYGAPRRRALRAGDWIGAVGDAFSMTIPLHRVGAWRRRVGERAAVRWPAFAATLRSQALRRLPQLRAMPGVQVFADSPGAEGAWPFFLLLLPSQPVRDRVLNGLAASPCGVSRLFVEALPDYAYLTVRAENAQVSHARDFAARTLTISNSPWLDDARFSEVTARMRALL